MQKQIRRVDEQHGIVQITTVDERWYARPTTDRVTGLPIYEYVPSVTWIAQHYPKGIAFWKWLAEKGWDEAEAIKQAAGDKGSKVHAAVSNLLRHQPLAMDAEYLNPSTGSLEALTLEEYECCMGLMNWLTDTRPEIIAQDLPVWNEQEGYAGTLDFLFVKDGTLYLPDLKTGQSVWPSHELQVSAYLHTPQVQDVLARLKLTHIKLAILQVGYKRNKKGFKWTPVDDQFDLFLSVKKIWKKETVGQTPLQRDYPLLLQWPDPALAVVNGTLVTQEAT